MSKCDVCIPKNGTSVPKCDIFLLMSYFLIYWHSAMDIYGKILSTEEQKVILTLCSMVSPEDREFNRYMFRIADFMKLLGVETKTKYTEIPKITRSLMSWVFEIEEDGRLIQMSWLSSAVYEKGSGYVELEFSPRLKPYLLQLKSLFTIKSARKPTIFSGGMNGFSF